MLSLKGVPVKENSEKVNELTHLQQRIKERLTEYDEIFNKSVKFHHVKKQVSIIIFILKNIYLFPVATNFFLFLVLPVIFVLPQTKNIYPPVGLNWNSGSEILWNLVSSNSGCKSQILCLGPIPTHFIMSTYDDEEGNRVTSFNKLFQTYSSWNGS